MAPTLPMYRLRRGVCWSLAAALAMLAIPAASSAMQVGAAGPNVLIRPHDAPTTTTRIHLIAAANEFESAQVVVRADGAALTGVDVDIVGALTAPGGGTIPASAFTVYRVGYYLATGQPSDGDLGGALGAFPDSLIPRVDHVWNEPRRAFPIDVPSGNNRLAWIDVQIPAGTPPGVYAGASVRVSAAGQRSRALPIDVEVIDLNLPSTTTLDGGFDLNPNRLCGVHNCSSFPGGATGLAAMYERVALDNRLTIAKPPTATPSGPTDSSYRTYTRPLLVGTAATRLRGAKLRTVTIYQWAVESADEWRRTAEADGFVGRVRFHCDEIATNATAWNQCRSDWTRANALWRGAANAAPTDLPLQVTTSIDDVVWARTHGFADFVSRIAVLIPVINRVHPKSVSAFPGRRAAFDSWSNASTTPGGAKRMLWSYTSCMSMGCSPERADSETEWRGWPSYGIDQPAMQARAMGWISWRYRTSGEYYYETARDLPTAWTDQWSSDGGNHGDGTLFYPGTVARVGGTHDVAIESIRLKRIRDGREDYEWLHVAEGAAGRAVVDEIARSAFASAFATDVSQATLDAARTDLSALVAGRGIRQRPASTTLARVFCGGRRATIVGTARGDVLRGTRGVDVIAGLGGNDRIWGFGRGDVICGGAGDDTIVTARDSRARDLVSCGTGRDRLVMDGRDRVLPGCERRTRSR